MAPSLSPLLLCCLTDPFLSKGGGEVEGAVAEGVK